MKASLRRQLNNALAAVPSFGTSIPLERILNLASICGLTPVQEDGTPWSGILCGDCGSCSIQLFNEAENKLEKVALQIRWWGPGYLGRPGVWETNCYVL